MSYKHESEFNLKQKIKVQDSGVVGQIISIEFYSSGLPAYLIAVWDHNEYKTYKLDAWQLESFESKSIGLQRTEEFG